MVYNGAINGIADDTRGTCTRRVQLARRCGRCQTPPTVSALHYCRVWQRGGDDGGGLIARTAVMGCSMHQSSILFAGISTANIPIKR